MKLFLTIIAIALLNFFPSVSSLPVSGSQVPGNEDGSSSSRSVSTPSTGGTVPKALKSRATTPRSVVELWMKEHGPKRRLEPLQREPELGDVYELLFIGIKQRLKGENWRAAVFVGRMGNVELFVPLFTKSEEQGTAFEVLEDRLPGLKQELAGISVLRDGKRYTHIGGDIRLYIPGFLEMEKHEFTGKIACLPEFVKNEGYGIRTMDYNAVIFSPRNFAGTSSGSTSANPSQSLPESSNAGHSHLGPSGSGNLRTLRSSAQRGLPSGSSGLASTHSTPYPTTAERAPRSPLGRSSSGQPRSVVGAVPAPGLAGSGERLGYISRPDSLNSHPPPGGSNMGGNAPSPIPHTQPSPLGQPLTALEEAWLASLSSLPPPGGSNMGGNAPSPIPHTQPSPLGQPLTALEEAWLASLSSLPPPGGSNMGGNASSPIPHTQSSPLGQPNDSGQGPLTDLEEAWLASLDPNKHMW